MRRDSTATKWSPVATAPLERSGACGLQRATPGEPTDAATPEAAVTLSVACSTIEERARIAAAMGRALADRVYVAPRVPDALPAAFARRLDAALYLVRPLGAGAYGSVCAAGFRQPSSQVTLATALSTTNATTSKGGENASPPSRDATRLPLAVKVTPGGAAPAVAIRESLLMGMLSALVKTRACPNLPCVYGTAVAYPTQTEAAMMRLVGAMPVGSVDIFQEMADCDLGAWMADGPLRSEAEWMSVIFQVCAGLAWAARVYDIANNDMYGRNVLLSRIITATTPSSFIDAETQAVGRGPTCTREDVSCPADPVFRYALQSRAYGWRRFGVRTRCWLARPTDYALATSDRLRALGVDVAGHDDLAELYGATPRGTAGPAPTMPTSASLASLVTAGARARHAIFHPYLNAYARDIAVLLATVAYETRAPSAVRRWALNGLYALYVEIITRQAAAATREAEPPMSALFAAAVRAAQRNVTAGAAGFALNRAFRQPDDLIDFMVGVLFDPAALGRAGLPAGLFADDAASVAAAGDQFFALPLLDTPPPIEPAVPGAPSPEPLRALARALQVPL